MLASAAFPAFLLTAAGFALFLIVSLSAPHIDHIYLLRLTTAGGASKIDLGVFGFCVEGMTASLSGAFTGATSLHDGCSKAQVAYTLPDILFGSLKIDGHDIVKRGLTGALVINPVASGLALISLVFAFFAWVCASRIMEILIFMSLFLSSLLAWLAFGLTTALVFIARHRAEKHSQDQFIGTVGTGYWLELAGTVCLSIAICAAGCGIFGSYRRNDDSNGRFRKGYSSY